jgi:hypothetical protein
MVGDITDRVLVQIVAFVFIPVVIGKLAEHHASISGYVESISMEIIEVDGIVITTGLYPQSPSVVVEAVQLGLYPVGAFHQDTYRIIGKYVPADLGIGDLFEQQPIGVGSPIIFESIF